MSKNVDITWKATLEEDGRPSFRVGRAGADVVAEWVDVAVLRAERSGASSALTFSQSADPRWRKKLERGLVRAMLAQLRGELTLHASALADDRRAVLLVGSSGAGKSTLAAALSDDRAIRLVADDASPISFEGDHVTVKPSDDELWLWRDARAALGLPHEEAAKAPVPAARVANAPVRVSAIVVLRFTEHDSRPRLVRLRGHDALAPLLAATVRFVVDEPEVQLREIADLERLASRTPIFELARSKNFAHLASTAALVRDLLRGGST